MSRYEFNKMKMNFNKIIECIRMKINDNRELRSNIYSLILYGSFIRGDFIKNVSDIDFFAVLFRESKNTINKLRNILNYCCKDVEAIEIDLSWECLGNLDDPLNKGYPYKFLTIYQEDFLNNHVVIYGSSIKNLIPKYNWKELVKWRVYRLLNYSNKWMNNAKMLHITAGEVIRLLALINGAKTIKKNDILKILRKIGDNDALKIFMAYLSGRRYIFDKDFLINFISSRIREILKEASKYEYK